MPTAFRTLTAWGETRLLSDWRDDPRVHPLVRVTTAWERVELWGYSGEEALTLPPWGRTRKPLNPAIFSGLRRSVSSGVDEPLEEAANAAIYSGDFHLEMGILTLWKEKQVLRHEMTVGNDDLFHYRSKGMIGRASNPAQPWLNSTNGWHSVDRRERVA